MQDSLFRTLSVALVVCLLVVGCDDNVFSGLNSEGTSDDPEVLLADARAALAKGDTTEAIAYLEHAYELDPDNAEVRVELVGTRFEMNDIDLLTIREIGAYIANSNKVAYTAKAGAPNYFCSFEGDPSNYTSFDYSQAPAYVRLASKGELFDEAIELLGNLDATEVELSQDLKARMLLIRAFTRAFQTIVEINTSVKERGVDLFRLPSGDIGVCSDASKLNSISEAQQLLDDIQAIIECTLLPGYEEAMDELRTRNEVLGGDPDNLIVEVMGDALDAMRNSINGECTATS